MKKLASLRQFLAENIPELKQDPDSLTVLANKGSFKSTATASLSFVLNYEAECIFLDYSGEADSIIVPLLVWIRTNQPELLMQDDFSGEFEAEILNNKTADISFKLKLSERVLVQNVNGKRVITYPPEPQLPDLTGPTGWELTAGGEIVTQ